MGVLHRDVMWETGNDRQKWGYVKASPQFPGTSEPAPPDHFDPLVLLHHARGDHRLDLGDCEAPARQTLRCRSDPDDRPHDQALFFH